MARRRIKDQQIPAPLSAKLAHLLCVRARRCSSGRRGGHRHGRFESALKGMQMPATSLHSRLWGKPLAPHLLASVQCIYSPNWCSYSSVIVETFLHNHVASPPSCWSVFDEKLVCGYLRSPNDESPKPPWYI